MQESLTEGFSFWLSVLAFGLYFVLDLGAYRTGPLPLVASILRRDKEERMARGKKAKSHGNIYQRSLVPVIEGRSVSANNMDLISLNRYLPPNYIVETRPSIHERREQELSRRLSTSLDTAGGDGSSLGGVGTGPAEPSTPDRAAKQQPQRTINSDLVDEEGVPYALLPQMEGCAYDGEGVKEMKKLFPDASVSRCVRFLVARKGVVKDAAAMMNQHLEWKKENYPIRRKQGIVAALSAKAFVVGGRSKSGDPTLYFRGAYYDTSVATSEDYCLAAAHAMDRALEGSGRLQVVVVAITAPVEGERNEPADINFLKGFVGTLSNNFPERMKAAYIFPFPFFGRVVWSVVKVCMDPRSQGKIKCIGYDGPGLPPEVMEVLDLDQVPVECRGKSKQPCVDLLASLVD
jgi:hypothetical protein